MRKKYINAKTLRIHRKLMKTTQKQSKSIPKSFKVHAKTIKKLMKLIENLPKPLNTVTFQKTPPLRFGLNLVAGQEFLRPLMSITTFLGFPTVRLVASPLKTIEQ